MALFIKVLGRDFCSVPLSNRSVLLKSRDFLKCSMCSAHLSLSKWESEHVKYFGFLLNCSALSSCVFSAPPPHPPPPLSQEGDDYEVIPNSKFCVSRTANKDNSSAYYINGKKATFREVGALLRSHGIDLDHNRFLILQVMVNFPSPCLAQLQFVWVCVCEYPTKYDLKKTKQNNCCLCWVKSSLSEMNLLHWLW